MEEYVDSGIHTYQFAGRPLEYVCGKLRMMNIALQKLYNNCRIGKAEYRKEKRNGKGQEISRAYYSDG